MATLKFYRNMSLGGTVAFLVLTLAFFDLFRGLIMTMFLLTCAVHFGSYQFMAFMSRAKLTETGGVIDSGTDLNMEGGLAEYVSRNYCCSGQVTNTYNLSRFRHVKDLVILTTGTQVLALVSNYFWFLLLLVPIRAFHLAWGSVIKPWLQSRKEQQQEPEVNEKKQRKLDRKMRRMK